MLEDEIRMQSRVTEHFYDQFSEEMEELEENESEEALLLVQQNIDV